MHTLLFNLKRAHHQSLAFLRKQLEPFADERITPARFDFLYAIYRHRQHYCSMSQVRIGLGCVKSNITRYAKLAVELGWAELYWDGQMTLKLTGAGVELVERVVRKTARAVDEHVADCVQVDDRDSDDRALRFEHAHDPIDHHSEFEKTNRKVRAIMRERVRPKVSFDSVMRALSRTRAVFWDTRLLDIYEEEFRPRVVDLEYLMLYRGRFFPVWPPTTPIEDAWPLQ